ncbi:hypothetical protein L5515_017966 [Caenorhabditis briggsae]|uniref:Uncharacterized protein n=1 Tax=Caenorhabditis briggsae TaxID=6238 RepID=A0AAE9JRN3_CAEBR|nr:hypothetical protein L5515_017966 [Caenorhabditis briggsae]
MIITSSSTMNSFAVFLAFAMLLATALARPGGNRYGWPSSYERFLEKVSKTIILMIMGLQPSRCTGQLQTSGRIRA